MSFTKKKRRGLFILFFLVDWIFWKCPSFDLVHIRPIDEVGCVFKPLKEALNTPPTHSSVFEVHPGTSFVPTYCDEVRPRYHRTIQSGSNKRSQIKSCFHYSTSSYPSELGFETQRHPGFERRERTL